MNVFLSPVIGSVSTTTGLKGNETERRKSYSDVEKLLLVKEFESSKFMTARKFCRIKRLPPTTFNRWVKAKKEGILTEANVNGRKKQRMGEFTEVEDYIVKYVALRQERFKIDKCGLSWLHLKHKCDEMVPKLLGEARAAEFKASAGWLNNVLKKRHNILYQRLHGEGNEMSEEEAGEKMKKFMEELEECCDDNDVPIDRIFNADQTGLFYAKLPNGTYCNAAERDSFRGVKRMKDKTRVTIMVCTSALGEKVPLSIVGKSKRPECFSLCVNNTPPMAYNNQSNAWFDKDVTIWWLNDVFDKWYHAKFGNQKCILLLDNCPAHNDLQETNYPPYIIIKFFPPNLTSRHQPMDMGIIASLKVGYKFRMLDQLLAICDDPDTYNDAVERGRQCRRGCKGLAYGAKPHVLDVMHILNDLWSGDKYCGSDKVGRCWRKANCLPTLMHTVLIDMFGSSDKKTIKMEKAESDSLCDVLQALTLKVTEESFPHCEAAADLHELLEYEPEVIAEGVGIWVDIERNISVRQVEIDEEMERCFNETTTTTVDDNDNCDNSNVSENYTSERSCSATSLNDFNSAMQVILSFAEQHNSPSISKVIYDFQKGAAALRNGHNNILLSRKRKQSCIQQYFNKN